MRNIVLLSEIFPPVHGGSGRWFYELYNRITDIKLWVVTNGHVSRDLPYFPHTVVERDLCSSEWGIISLRGICFYCREILNLLRVCRSNNITQVQAGRVLHEGLIGAIVSRFLRLEFIVFVHGEDIKTTATSREQDLLAKFVFRSATRIICNSHNSAAILGELGYEQGRPVSVIHPGADIDTFIPQTKSLDFREAYKLQNKRILLTVGRLQTRKGQDHMISAMPELLTSYPDLHYVIVGSGDDEQKLRHSITELNLSDSVSMFCDCSDEELVQFYQQCDLFILPNRDYGQDIEGFGMVLVEAQAAGKVVITGNSGGTRETLLPNETGFVINCDTPSDIIAELSPILADDQHEKLNSMSEHTRRFVKANFSWEVHTKKFFSIVFEKGAL